MEELRGQCHFCDRLTYLKRRFLYVKDDYITLFMCSCCAKSLNIFSEDTSEMPLDDIWKLLESKPVSAPDLNSRTTTRLTKKKKFDYFTCETCGLETVRLPFNLKEDHCFNCIAEADIHWMNIDDFFPKLELPQAIKDIFKLKS